MIVLHAGWYGNRLELWGEKAPERSITPPKIRRGAVPLSPYDAGFAELSTACLDTGVDFFKESPASKTRFIWLPSTDSLPLPSSPLIAETPDDSESCKIAPWKITTCLLSPSNSLDLLCNCAGKVILAPGVVVGEDIASLTKLLAFAGGLVARESFLPDLTYNKDIARAWWTPILSLEDRTRLEDLRQSIPASVRAIGGKTEPPHTSSEITVRELLRMFVDELVRTSVRNSFLVTNRKLMTTPKTRHMPLHDAWLIALHDRDGVIKDSESTLSDFSLALNEWKRPINYTISAPFRFCFRLEEPVLDNGEWLLRYFLQPVDDQSLLIPLSDIWKGNKSVVSMLLRNGIAPAQYALIALGQASSLSEIVMKSLQSSQPSEIMLNTSEAYAFLSMDAPGLEQAGYGVLLPAWWSKYGTKVRIGLKASVSSGVKPPTGITIGNPLEFQWRISLGDADITEKELKELAKLKSPLVKIRGQWVELNADEIKETLNFLKSKSALATPMDFIAMALREGEIRSGIEHRGVEASGWIGDLLSQLQGTNRLEELPQPAGFEGELRPYQVRGYSWLSFLRRWGLGACLADDMGLGKTVQTLAMIQRDREQGDLRPALLVCPTSVMENWRKECMRFTPNLPVMIHHGSGRDRKENFKRIAEKNAIVITSYALLHRDKESLQKVTWAGVILDEAQNIKNPDTRQAVSAREIKADYRIALTGTPVENHVGELWSIMEFLNAGFLGSRTDYLKRFFYPIQSGSDKGQAQALKKLIEPFILRRLKSDKSIISDLPEKQEMKVYCTLTKEQASLYMAVATEAENAIIETDGIQRRGLILATLSKLKQVCNHPAHFLGDHSAIPGRSGKVARLTEMLEEILDMGESALIFSQFQEMGEILQRFLQESFGVEIPFLHGGVSREKRERMVERFQTGKGGGVFILSLKAGGTGLNLTRANHVFHFDRWWNPAVENQATDRAYRIGQKSNVQVHKFVCAGTLEEKIDDMIERKKDIAQSVIGEGEGWLTELTTAELKQLFALAGETAVGNGDER